MEEITTKTLLFLKKLIKANIKIIKTVALIVIAIALSALAFIAIKITNSEDVNKELQIEETAAIIDSIKPSGKLILYKSKIEDFVIKKEEENRIFYSEEHSVACVLSCTCYYYVDLDSIKYIVDDSVVIVKMPEVKYACDSQGSNYIEDDQKYWADNRKKTERMPKDAEAKIRRRFDTMENRKKAQLHAEECVREILEGMGLHIKFGRGLIRKKE